MAAATQPKQKANAIPALMPLPHAQSPFFWPVAALNNDAEVQALLALHQAACKKSPSAANHTTRIALIGAVGKEEINTTNSFRSALEDGVLLYAWRGNKALVPGLAAGAKGGAA